MSALWYAILALMLTVYVILDGRNFGIGIVHWLVAKNSPERRQVVAAVGPFWSWHEVWLIAAGGVMVMAFPSFMAASFSGYYLALFLVLWCVVLRGISLEVGGHFDDALWQAFWDGVFVFSNVLLAILFGAAFGNVVRGVPLSADGTFHLPFFTNFRVHGQVGLLDWYTLSVAVFFALMLAAHGATHLVLRTDGKVHDRARALAVGLWMATAPAFLVISALTHRVRPEVLQGMPGRPIAWLTLAGGVAGLAMLIAGFFQQREARAVVGSSLLIFGLMGTCAATLFPVLVYSTLNATDRLTAQGCAAPDHSLWIATAWWFPALLLALGYVLVVQRKYAGKISLTESETR